MIELRHLIAIAAEPEVVFKALTTSEGLAGWWTPDAEAKPLVGSLADFRFGDRYHDVMRITALEPERLVAWDCLEGDPEWIGTTLRFALEKTDTGTTLRFTHGNWREPTDFFAACNTHWGRYMRSLRLYCETGYGDPFVAQP